MVESTYVTQLCTLYLNKINMNTQIIGVRELRQNLAQITNKMTKENINYFVFKNNKPVFELKPISKKKLKDWFF